MTSWSPRARFRPALNAAAISGEYLSAASFLGIAGLVVSQGLGSLWYSVGYTAGYLVLLLLVAAPLRRFGAYTIPDFAAGRLGSRGLRQTATALVLVIGWFYLLPQMKGAGITLQCGARHAVLGRRGHPRRGGERQHRDGRDEGDHLRPVLPVLAEAVRDRHSRARAADRDRARLGPQPEPGSGARCSPSATVVSVPLATDFTLTRPAEVTVTGLLDQRQYRPARRCALCACRHVAGAGAQIGFARGRPGPRQPGHGTVIRRSRGIRRSWPRARTARTRSRPPTASSSPRSSAPSGCRTSWCASTPTPTARRPGARP